VGGYFEKLGAHRAQPIEEKHEKITLREPTPEPESKSPRFLQGKLNL